MSKWRVYSILFCCGLLTCSLVKAQTGEIRGKVMTANGRLLQAAEVVIQLTNFRTFTDSNGIYRFNDISPGEYEIVAFVSGYAIQRKTITLNPSTIAFADFKLDTLFSEIKDVTITKKGGVFAVTHLRSVEGTAIYAAKKNEVVLLDKVTGNLAANNAREVFARVAGVNIWESDGAGIQLGIGARGLNPKRTAEFNTRLNGYDMSADALGYPESYYTPPTEALEKIEVVRGAASLQYGTQFGGMINFVMKKGPKDKPIEALTRQTVGSFGFFNSFNSVGGTTKKLNYYAYFQHKRGDGWRPNESFGYNNGYVSLNYKVSDRFSAGFDLTLMTYEAQQAGGLTDALFAQNPRQSIRDRNWFSVDWQLAALNLNYKFSGQSRLNSRFFGLLAGRDALGFLGQISRIDPLQERDLLMDRYSNFGNETRFIHTYNTQKNPSTFLIGVRYYEGLLDRKQGNASSGSDADFTYLNPNDLEGSDFDFPSRNIAVFTENILAINRKLSLTPGARFEYIHTSAEGFYKEVERDLAGNIIREEQVADERTNDRSFLLLGLGVSYKARQGREWYLNFSQNYRAINFNDMRVINPNFQVDPNLKDENGFNADIGFRGKLGKVAYFDVSAFYMAYRDRIGIVLREDSNTFNLFRYRTNIADSRNIGLESLIEIDLTELFSPKTKATTRVTAFVNSTLLDARYFNSREPAFENKKVEQVPQFLLRTGAGWQHKNIKASLTYSYISEHFTDATNSRRTANAVNGIIPAYFVMDASVKYLWKRFTFQAGSNNVTNNIYFTRRADGYPGPGIIPAQGRSFYFGIEARLF